MVRSNNGGEATPQRGAAEESGANRRSTKKAFSGRSSGRSIRTMCVLVATAVFFSSRQHKTLTITKRKTMDPGFTSSDPGNTSNSSGVDFAQRNRSVRNDIGGTPQAALSSASSSASVPYSLDAEPPIYPPEFYRVQQRQRDRNDATKPWRHAPNHTAVADASSWTHAERSWYRSEFEALNRDSVFSLLLLEGEGSASTDTVLQWSDDQDEDFGLIKEHGRKRHQQGLYEYHDVQSAGENGSNQLLVLEAAWGNDAHVGNPSGKTGSTTNKSGDSASPGHRGRPEPYRPRLIVEPSLCHAFRHAGAIANFSTPHVLVTHMNENWGALSSEVAGRTAEWGDIVRNWRALGGSGGCDPLELEELYLDSPHTLAVFTTQHQALFDHPKVHSIPIGVANQRGFAEDFLARLRSQKKRSDQRARVGSMRVSPPGSETPHAPDPRPQLLMINAFPSDTRAPQIEAVVRSFASSGHRVANTYKAGGTGYYNELSRSKFVLCPSGMGYDTYRIWEALSMGAVPVLERHTYRYEAVGSGRGRATILRTVGDGEGNTTTTAIGSSIGNTTNNTTTPFLLEYSDGWQKTLDGLPVVWTERGKDGGGGFEGLTPEFLERAYDDLAARSFAGGFRYEKLTSLYWIRFLESFLLLPPDQARREPPQEAPLRRQSQTQKWNLAMESLSSTFNHHRRNNL
ncbi:unnamed protein product [Pseudo-nitzschia multistriata]|uniref:RXYLT1 C-terminal domain-containing protein n=1 Tax=Pseudo-nitzschia multistriata TaxID=183589 RepID=A0A448YVM2_9STRA|nr:unnamed protein product [Pseudo-nitzschia multistriata]